MRERPTVELCSQIQGHIHRVMLIGEEGITSKAFCDLMWEAEVRRRNPHALEVPPLPPSKEPPVAPRPIITEHRVKKHVFSDGVIWESCAATGCAYSTTTGGDRPQVKTHTDRAIGIYDEPEFEQTADDPMELCLEEKPVIAGEDQPDENDEGDMMEETPVACGVEGDE